MGDLDLDTLENLSNSELRAKCIQHGLPNVPVTDSSRKILIRRLHAVTNPQLYMKPSKKGNRRETKAASRSTTISNESVPHIKKSTMAERRSFHGGMEKSQNKMFTTSTPEMAASENHSYLRNNDYSTNQYQRFTNDATLKKRLQHLTMTQPSIISHVNNNMTPDRVDNSYSTNLSKKISKKESLPLPELVNDTRSENVSTRVTTTTDIGDEITTIYTPKTPIAYSKPYASFTPLSKSPTLYPRLDDLIEQTISPSRLSRSNSLTKSGVVTTSFTQESASLPSVGEDIVMTPPEEVIEEPLEYRFRNKYQASPLYGRNTFRPTLNSTSLTSSKHDNTDIYRSISPKRRTTHDIASYSGSSSSDEENSFSGVDYSSDDDDIALMQNPPSYLEQEPKDISLGEFLQILDQRYHLKPFAVMTGCLLLAVFIYTFFLPHYP